MEYKDYYQALGINRNATTEEIKAAYRRLARKYHPDVNPGNKEAEKKFKEINEANAVLSNEETRKKYDRLGADWERVSRNENYARQYYSSPGTGRGPAQVKFDFGDLGDFSDFFSTFFSGENIGDIFEFGRGDRHTGGFRTGTATSSADRQPRHGSDIEQTLEITLEEAFNGTTRLLRLQIPGTTASKEIKVKIPKGVTNGSKIRLAGQGQPGPFGGPAGDLYLVIKITPHHFFQIDGHNLKCEIPALDYEAILGTTVEMTTLAGKVNLKIPAGTQTGTVLKLKNQGLPTTGKPAKAGQGDILAKVKIIIPKNLTAEEKKLVEEFRKLRENKDKK